MFSIVQQALHLSSVEIYTVQERKEIFFQTDKKKAHQGVYFWT